MARLSAPHLPTLSLGVVALFGMTAAAADISVGKSLHAANCVECHMVTHDDAFYHSRVGGQSDRGIDSRASLHTMVQACATNFDLDWFDEEVGAVTDYLNVTYYELD